MDNAFFSIIYLWPCISFIYVYPRNYQDCHAHVRQGVLVSPFYYYMKAYSDHLGFLFTQKKKAYSGQFFFPSVHLAPWSAFIYISSKMVHVSCSLSLSLSINRQHKFEDIST